MASKQLCITAILLKISTDGDRTKQNQKWFSYVGTQIWMQVLMLRDTGQKFSLDAWIHELRKQDIQLLWSNLEDRKDLGSWEKVLLYLDMDDPWTVMETSSSLPCLQNSQNGQSPLLFVPNIAWQGSCWRLVLTPAPQLRLEHTPNPVHWAQEVTDTELACRCSAGFFCPVKQKDGQTVTTSKIFFHFFCSTLTLWSKH